MPAPHSGGDFPLLFLKEQKMAPNPAMDGNSTSIAFGTSSFEANIIGIDGPNATRESIETSHLGTVNNMTFLEAALSDAGEISLEIEFDPDLVAPIGTSATPAATEEITVTWPLPVGMSTASTWVFDGFVTSYSGGAANGERMTGTMAIKITGDVVQTPSAV